ncbi:hypothetical protein OHA18_32080 [Kribbella sp. NBC_00709]|uniref:hypothetical protein n=1 Tax=Kribbella sp. NBC_00709 TaxID=2975972 RepID=UPI002E2E40B9|nr:hypothetical protein [Kribbella sp. NBC_00709]
MSGKRDKSSPGNPWVNQPGPEPDDVEPEEQLPPSPWDLEVPPPPSPWGGGGAPGPGPGQAPGPGPGAGPGQSLGPATETSSAWGENVGPPSLRRPPPEKKSGFRIPPLLIPVGAGLIVVALVAVALVLLSGGGDDKADPTPSTSGTPVGTPTGPTASYQPPPNAIAVGFGVSIVPVQGWSLFTKETQGKQVATYPPNDNLHARAFLWVRQKQNVTAKAYLLGIIEGETEEEVAQLGNVRNLPCPKDVLVECVAIDYTSTAKENGVDVKVQGSVEVYRRKDNVVTALDFRTRVDFAQKAEADAAIMKKSVIDSL